MGRSRRQVIFFTRRNVGSGRRNRVVLAPRPWRYLRELAPALRGQERPLPGEITYKPQNHCAGKAGMSRLYLSNPCAFFRYLSHTVLRAQSAPGFPCALFPKGEQTRCKTRAKARRGNERCCLKNELANSLSSRTSERSERDPGPMTTGSSFCKGWSSNRFWQRRPVVMGPCVRRDDSMRYNSARNFSLVWNSTLVFPTREMPS